MNSIKHVCILGCGRSGTSIFGELFEAIEIFSYLSEPPLNKLPKLNFKRPIALKVPRPDDDDPTSPGLPFLWPQFLEIFPKPPVIFWQVRHPLDTICSLRVGIAKNWGHHPRPKDWQSRLENPLLEQCAYHWNYLNTIGYDQISNQVHLNKFEDMLDDPQATAVRCLSLAGVDCDLYTEAIDRWAQRVQDKNNEHFVEAVCSQPYSTNDHSKKIARWKENLTDTEVQQVLPLISQGSRRFGYQLPHLEKPRHL